MFKKEPLDIENLEDNCYIYGDDKPDIFDLYYNDTFFRMTTDILHQQYIDNYGYFPAFDFLKHNKDRILYNCYKHIKGEFNQLLTQQEKISMGYSVEIKKLDLVVEEDMDEEM